MDYTCDGDPQKPYPKKRHIPIWPMLGAPLAPPNGPSPNPTVYKSTTPNAFKANLFQAFR